MIPSRTVGAALNAVAEELQFRSVIMGLMIVGGLDPGLAVGLQAVLFGAAHRRVWRERDWYFVIGSVILGYACGLVTISTESVIPAMVGHFAVTMGIFAFAGGRLRMQRI
jgi:membrane protease YdiL (CAAX protease family)